MLAVGAALVLAGCGSSGSKATSATTTSVPPRGHITRAQLSVSWPLTVDEGVLHCQGDGVTFEAPDGTVYALNGTARRRKAGKDVTPIWADNPSAPGKKMNMEPLIAQGLNLC
jgi:ABC-type Fe3+-hydroxamate transport system substrate-binding protein